MDLRTCHGMTNFSTPFLYYYKKEKNKLVMRPVENNAQFIDLDHYVDPNGGKDACKTGVLLNSYPLAYGKGQRLVHDHVIGRFIEPGSADAIEHLNSDKTTHCYRLSRTRNQPVPDWVDDSKFSGKIDGATTRLQSNLWSTYKSVTCNTR